MFIIKLIYILWSSGFVDLHLNTNKKKIPTKDVLILITFRKGFFLLVEFLKK